MSTCLAATLNRYFCGSRCSRCSMEPRTILLSSVSLHAFRLGSYHALFIKVLNIVIATCSLLCRLVRYCLREETAEEREVDRGALGSQSVELQIRVSKLECLRLLCLQIPQYALPSVYPSSYPARLDISCFMRNSSSNALEFPVLQGRCSALGYRR
ncbi:hypothetical protein C8J56DRAFT_359061 [Mycena floridula]|nr:hypothetical protein C8J56DRAFT_359061 [Mycena floridula]